MATAIPKAYLASSAIRCRDVETGTHPRCVGRLSLHRCHLPVPPSSTGSRGLNSPRFGGTMRHADSSPSIPPRFVACARRYHPSTCGFAPSDARCCVPASGLVSRCPPPGGLYDGDDEASRVPGKPPARMPRAPTPARSPPPRPLRCGEMTFRPTHDVGPHKQCISGLNHAAYGLPCERVAPGVTPGPRITRFRLAADLGRMDWIPTGCRTRFQRSHHGILSPLTGLSRHTRCCTNRHGPTRCHPTGSSPADAI